MLIGTSICLILFLILPVAYSDTKALNLKYSKVTEAKLADDVQMNTIVSKNTETYIPLHKKTFMPLKRSSVISNKKNNDLNSPEDMAEPNIKTDSELQKVLDDSIQNRISDFIKLFYSDSDGGFNLKKKGVFITPTDFHEDYCLDSNNLVEGYCFDDNRCYRFNEECPDGFECEDGRCTDSTFSQIIQDSDGDDSGIDIFNIYEKGTVLIGAQTFYDSCLNSTHVNEITTASGSKLLKCPEGMTCSDGACIGAQVSCNDYVPQNLQGTFYPADQAMIIEKLRGQDSRFTLIFVGSDYNRLYSDHNEAMEAFLSDIRIALGEGQHQGLFDIEPYKSNKNKFTIKYVDRFNDLAEWPGYGSTSQDETARTDRWTEGALNVKGVAGICPERKNAFVVHMVPTPGINDGVISIMTNRENYIQNFSTPQQCINNAERCLTVLNDLNNDSCIDDEDYPSLDPSGYDLTVDYDGNGLSESEEPIYTGNDRGFYNSCVAMANKIGLCSSDVQNNNALNDLCSAGWGKGNIGNRLNIGKLLAHELSHKFGMDDLHIQSTDSVTFEDYTTEYPNHRFGNCFIADSLQACYDNAPWKDMIGNGCGTDGIEDCNVSDQGYNAEVTCYEGCLRNVKSYRSVRRSIMTYGTADTTPATYDYPLSLGKWNEWYIEHVMNARLQLTHKTSALDIIREMNIQNN